MMILVIIMRIIMILILKMIVNFDNDVGDRNNN